MAAAGERARRLKLAGWLRAVGFCADAARMLHGKETSCIDDCQVTENAIKIALN